MKTPMLPLLCAAAIVVACIGGNGDDGSPFVAEERTVLLAGDAGDHASAIAAADFDGDGHIDIALGAALADGPGNQRADAGELHIFFGPVNRGVALDAASDEGVITIFGATAGDNLGRALAAADFDGDGVSDIAFGAPGRGEAAGAVYVMFGSQDLSEREDVDLAGEVIGLATFEGEDAGDFTGLALSAASLGGDGATLLVGALTADGADNNRTDAGAVFLISDLVPGASAPIAAAGTVIHGLDAGDHLGEALTSADINGDGLDDLVLVSPFGDGPEAAREDSGETYVLFGPAVPESLETPDMTIYGPDEGDQLGHAVAAGQADGRPGDDVWLGAVSADGPENGVDLAGEAILIAGGPEGSRIVDTRDRDARIVVYGPEQEARLGRAAATGDLDGDGLVDLVVSAPNLEARRGVLYMVRGGEDRLEVVATGDSPGDVLGTEVFGGPPILLADVDSDGSLDLLAAAAEANGPDGSRTDAGEAYILWGPLR